MNTRGDLHSLHAAVYGVVVSERLYTPAQAARALGVHTTTLWRWANAGHITPVITPGGHRRYRPADIDEFYDHRSTPTASDPEPTPQPPTRPPIRWQRPPVTNPGESS